jgi:hypothetical protein
MSAPIRKLKEEFTSVYQAWFADDAGAAAKFKLIRAMFIRLQELVPEYGSYPEPAKSILIVAPHNLDAVKL